MSILWHFLETCSMIQTYSQFWSQYTMRVWEKFESWGQCCKYLDEDKHANFSFQIFYILTTFVFACSVTEREMY